MMSLTSRQLCKAPVTTETAEQSYDRSGRVRGPAVPTMYSSIIKRCQVLLGLSDEERERGSLGLLGPQHRCEMQENERENQWKVLSSYSSLSQNVTLFQMTPGQHDCSITPALSKSLLFLPPEHFF